MDIVRSWKDPQSRSADMAHPSGSAEIAELTELEMDEVSGAGSGLVGTFGCCWCVPWYSGWTVCGLVCDHPGC
ncbi:mersacidin/lichenicidin family type 2 lantibiotic [Ornithinicoccus hortensis]|uniref:Mersacidin/lichenicidin family type 2 lantibiotic n=1 Tax=Ornithinicoccus hortensis TaxID=82346 RepID=A0A542YTX8_9MICO|nr:mersacidin/lichenicidin family type 2 lantibiotic [Ornithinicoccus hortensis]